jgi:lysozyme
MATRLSGIDVSHYQGVVDWAKIKAANVTFAFAKATEGANNTDAKFAANWVGIRNAGLVRGAYHFFHPSQDPAAQAQHFLQTVQLSPGDLPPVIDVESADGVSNSVIQSGVKTWLDAVAAQTGVKPMIYASPGFWNQHLNDQFGGYPLWVAQYGVNAPRLPKGWTNWTFWQYSQTGRMNGVLGNVDLDYFEGSLDDLTAFLGSSSTQAATAPPAPAASTQTYTIQSGDTLGTIAAQFGVTVDALASANGIQDPDLIQVGQLLQIPQAG